MIVCVIEWGSETLREPSVFWAVTMRGALHWAAREIQGLVFDDGGEIDAFRDTYRPDMTPGELQAWHEGMWDLSTDAWVGVYVLGQPAEEAELLGNAASVDLDE